MGEKCKSLRIVLFLGLFLVACRPQPPAQGIRGLVLLGPLCPVVQVGQECPDKPYQTDLVAMDANATRMIKKFSSDANGRFEVLLPVGDYVIRSPEGSTLPYCNSEDPIHVEEGAMTEATVVCDTGIR